MKNVAYVICFVLIGSAIGCAAGAAGLGNVEGSWVFTDAGEQGLVEKTLVFDKGSYRETSKENGVSVQNSEGIYSLKQEGNFVEIVFESGNTRVYKGRVAKTGLMIEKINGVELSPPLYFKRG